MAHLFSGAWTSFIVLPTGRRVREGDFDLVIDEATGVIDAPGSTHSTLRLKRGHASRVDEHRIEIVNRFGTFFEGVLVENNAGRLKVVGYRKLNAETPLAPDGREGGAAEESEPYIKETTGLTEEEIRLLTQDVIIWVGTKP